MDPFLLNNDRTISEVDEVWYPYIKSTLFVEPEVLLQLMLHAQSESKNFVRPKDEVPDAIAELLGWILKAQYPPGCQTIHDIYQLGPEELKPWMEVHLDPVADNILVDLGETLDTQL